MSLIQRIPWRQQPQIAVGIDWNNPVSRGIAQGIVASPFRDITSDRKATQNTSISNVASGFVGQHLLGATGYINTPTSVDAGPWTIITYAVKTSASGIAAAIATHSDTGQANSTYDRSLFIGSDNSVRSYIYDGAQKSSAIGAVLTGVPFFAAATSTGSVLNSWFNNYKSPDIATSNSGFAGYSAPKLIIGYGGGGTAGGGSYALTSDVTAAFVIKYNRVLSDLELVSIFANPWQLFAPLPRRIWAPVSAGGGAYTITAAAGSYALAGKTAALLKTRILSAAAGSYALTGNTA
jgi:hypothetical protein